MNKSDCEGRADRRGALLCARFHLHHRAAAFSGRDCDRRDPASEHLALGARTSSGSRRPHQGGAPRGAAAGDDQPTHLVPVYVGDPELCKAASDLLLTDHGLYLQPINYPLNVELSLPIFRLALAVFIPWRGADRFDRRAGWHPR